MELLAVYGTLKRNEPNHLVIMDSAEYLGQETISGWRMYDLGAFPAVVPSLDQEDSVLVEVYQVDDLRGTDRLEGYPHLYDRIQVPTQKGDAWLYYMHTPPKLARSRITSGIWE